MLANAECDRAMLVKWRDEAVPIMGAVLRGQLRICRHAFRANMAHCEADRRSSPPHQLNENYSPETFGAGTLFRLVADAIHRVRSHPKGG